MKNDPLKHHRRSIRLSGFDYAAPGAYFVTLCTFRRELFFDQTRVFQIAEACWREIPAHAPRVELDEWVVMPNHIHGIIVIREKDNDIEGRGVQLNAPTLDINDGATNAAMTLRGRLRQMPALNTTGLWSAQVEAVPNLEHSLAEARRLKTEQ